jgi:hypothetical protein
MFASGCYFEKLTNNWITPVFNMNASVEVNPGLRQAAKWELINGPGSLPSNVDYLTGGIVDARYTTAGLTNAGNVQIPNGFVFEWGRERAVATVRAVRPVCTRSDLLPSATGHTTVEDRRLPEVAMPNDDWTFSAGEFLNFFQMASILTQHSNNVSALLWKSFSSQDQAIVANCKMGSGNLFDARDIVLQGLAKIVKGPCFYESNRFHGITLRSATSNLLASRPTGTNLTYLNRLLIEDAFPRQFFMPTQPALYSVRDGVEWLPLEEAKKVYVNMKPMPLRPKPSKTVTEVFYVLMLSLSAVFLFFMSRLKRKGNMS